MALKKRYWSAIGYPESLPENWKEVLTETHLPICISPLHDKDINESTGEPKKPHYHILLCFDGPTTKENVRNITDSLKCPMPVPVDSVRGAVRYQTHKDNPEKAQYDEKGIVTLNGFDLAGFCELTAGEVNRILDEMVTLIREECITEYSDLINLLQDKGMTDQQNVAMSHTYFLDSYIKSVRNKAKNDLKTYKVGIESLLNNIDEKIFNGVKSEERRKELKELYEQTVQWKRLLEELPF